MANLSEYLDGARGRQAKLAKRLGLGAGTLSSIRSGKRRPSTELAKRIEAATEGEVSAGSLLGLSESGSVFQHESPPRDLKDGRWGAVVGVDGSLVLTPEVVRALGFTPGELLVLRPEGEDVRINSADMRSNESVRNSGCWSLLVSVWSISSSRTNGRKPPVSKTVVDASAVLAFILQETGAEAVADLRGSGVISTVNLAEVASRLVDLGYTRRKIDAALNDLFLTVEPFGKADATQAALLRTSTRHVGLSLGDRACLALAMRERLPVLTGDRDWSKVDVGVDIRLIR